MKYLFLISLALAVLNCSGQSSFKRLPKPTNRNESLFSSTKAVKAFRFTGPIAGFMYPQNQVVTGIGYGFQRMHFVDSTQKYYTDFSISGVVYAGGNTAPNSINNIMSIGISLGVLNQALMVGPAFNLPQGSHKGSIGIVFNVSMPLNN